MHWQALLSICVILVIISEYQVLTLKPVAIEPEKPPSIFKTKEWLREWRKVRYRALVRDKGMCQCCGRTAQDGVQIHVDHVLPKSKYPALSLELSNLQTLCADENIPKSNTDMTDWR